MGTGRDDINEFQLAAILENVAPVFTGQAGKRMKLLRMALKLDQRQLAALLGVGHKTVCGAENGARAQRNPIPMQKFLATFGVRGVVYVLNGKYAQAFEERAKFIHAEYWQSKHASQGYRVKHADRPHLSIKVSKHDLLLENKLLTDEIQQLREKKAGKKGED